MMVFALRTPALRQQRALVSLPRSVRGVHAAAGGVPGGGPGAYCLPRLLFSSICFACV